MYTPPSGKSTCLSVLLAAMLLAALVLPNVGCRSGSSAEALVVDIGKRNPEQLMRFYLGAIDGVGGDSLLTTDGRRVAVRGDRIEALTGYRADTNSDGRLDWDETVALVAVTYRAGERYPATRDELEAQTDYRNDDVSFTVDLQGTMTVATRRIFVPMSALRAAVASVDPANPRVMYPVSTTIVGEHWLDNALAETTVMTKRQDGFWDYYVYNASGQLADSTSTEPRPLQSPTQCAGCHFGSRTFEPEKSFPAPARPGPDGPRQFVSDVPRVSPDVVAFFDEHRRRSDTVLGIYATLFVGQLQEMAAAGNISDSDRRILATLFGEGE